MNTGGKKKKRNVAAACESFEGVERIGREKGNREQRLLLGTMERTRMYMRTSMWYDSSGGKMVFCVCSREKRRTTIAGILACARHTRFPHLSSPSPPLFLFLSRTLEGLSLGATARESLESHAGGTWPERGQLTHVHVVRVSYYMLHVTDVPFHWQRRNRRIGCSRASTSYQAIA